MAVKEGVARHRGKMFEPDDGFVGCQQFLSVTRLALEIVRVNVVRDAFFLEADVLQYMQNERVDVHQAEEVSRGLGSDANIWATHRRHVSAI